MRIWTKDNKRRWIIPVIAFWLLLASLLSSACFLAGCGRGSGLNSSSGQEQEGFFEEGEESAQSENTADTPAEVYVHVCGCVKKPGLYILAAGSRVGDAVEMAGGMTKEADNAGVNLAALLEDGQQIYVPDQSEGRDRPDRGASDSGVEPESPALQVVSCVAGRLFTDPATGEAGWAGTPHQRRRPLWR